MYLSTRHPTQNTEVNSLRRDVERLKELRAEQELKTKWHQNKLKSELEAHKVEVHRASNSYFQCFDCLKY